LLWGDDGYLRVWNIDTYEELGLAMRQLKVKGALLLHDDTQVIAWFKYGSIRIWDLITRVVVGPNIQQVNVQGALPAEDESSILVWSKDGTIGVWDATLGYPIRRIDGLDVEGAYLFDRGTPSYPGVSANLVSGIHQAAITSGQSLLCQSAYSSSLT
jgi:WD40 repeat protein